MIIYKNILIFFLINDLMQYYFIIYWCYIGQGQEEVDDFYFYIYVIFVFMGRREFVLNIG